MHSQEGVACRAKSLEYEARALVSIQTTHHLKMCLGRDNDLTVAHIELLFATGQTCQRVCCARLRDSTLLKWQALGGARMEVAMLSSRALCASRTNLRQRAQHRTAACRVHRVVAAVKPKTVAPKFSFGRRKSIPEVPYVSSSTYNTMYINDVQHNEPPRDDSKFATPYAAAAATLGAVGGFQIVAAPNLTA
eukprot:9404595-Pyramimonas_sp.AAC.1